MLLEASCEGHSIWLGFGVLWVEFLDLIQQNKHYLVDWWFSSFGKLYFKVVWVIKKWFRLQAGRDRLSSNWCDTCSPIRVTGQLVSSWSHRAKLFIFSMTAYNVISSFSLNTFTFRIPKFFLSLLFYITFALFFCCCHFFFLTSWALALNLFFSSILNKIFPESKLCLNA